MVLKRREMRRLLGCVVPGLLATVLGAGGGCGTTDLAVLVPAGEGPGGGMDSSVVTVEAQAPLPDAPVDAPVIGTEQEYCEGTGPPALVATTDAGTVSMCPDQLAQNAFRYALCLCSNYTNSQGLITDAFDGTQGPYPSTATGGGSVGVNGNLAPGPMNINGSLWASDMATNITTSTAMSVSGDLHTQGELHGTSLLVQGDAWMASGLQTSGNVTIKGTLHVPAIQPTSVGGTFTFGAMDTMTLPYAPACYCPFSPVVDVAGVVRTYQEPSQNDDVALGILPTMLENVQPGDEPTDGGTIVLPCGRIFLTQIGANAPIHLMAQGRVALFVAGDLSVSDFRIDVPSTSELDLFVGGSVTVRGIFQVGDPSNPARARTYVGGTTVNLQSAATLAGNLYAPNANIVLGGTAPTTLYGAIFANGLSSGSDLTIHYDKAILTPPSTRACAAPTSCTSCNDCNGQPCNSLTCGGTCADSSQCCAPLVCNGQGVCVPDVIPR